MKPGKEPIVKEIESPSGLDLNPEPPSTVRLSKRAGVLALVVVFAVVASVGYGIATRRIRPFPAEFHPGDSKGLTAATDAGKVIAAQIPNRALLTGGSMDRTSTHSEALQPPGQTRGHPPSDAAGQPAQSPTSYAPAASAPQYREPTPEEKRLALAYEREMQALDAPTGSPATAGASANRLAASSGSDSNGSQLANLLRALQGTTPTARASNSPSNAAPSGVTIGNQSSNSAEEYETQNMQSAKERFLAWAQAGTGGDALIATRTKPVSRYEIKAGWDIPAVLEPALNSDLPGEIKALVRENVYDTATGRYLLIPQGARLIGTYDTRVSYGQNGIQVLWNRLIFPDGSSIDLEGMVGQDSSGYSGFRHDVDNHYKRLLGFGLLTSAFSASFQLSQSRRNGALGYPSPAEIAGSAVGGQVSQLGADVTRRNLNIQPTIKVPVGYRFNVRVNRDILFESPYQPTGG
jgi:type IV secretion system protein VirB10